MNGVIETQQTVAAPKVLTMDYDYQSPEGRMVQVQGVPVKTRIDATGEVHQVFSSDVASRLYELIGQALENNSLVQQSIVYTQETT
jgi:hypothetical protein